MILSWNPPQNQSFLTGVVIQKNGLDFLEVEKEVTEIKIEGLKRGLEYLFQVFPIYGNVLARNAASTCLSITIK